MGKKMCSFQQWELEMMIFFQSFDMEIVFKSSLQSLRSDSPREINNE
jgi:hypothetical protein